MQATLAGKLLVAMPGIGDPRFERAVIVVCQHDEASAMGLIVNKPKDQLSIGDVLDHLGIIASPELAPVGVRDGGPVKPDRGYVLHSDDFAAPEGTTPVADGLALTATREVLEAMAGESPPAAFILALGYSGWEGGQLEAELKRNAWLVVELDRDIVFGEDHQGKWTRAIASLGLDPTQLVPDQGRA